MGFILNMRLIGYRMGILFSIAEATVLCADTGVDTIMTDNMGVMSSGTLTHYSAIAFHVRLKFE